MKEYDVNNDLDIETWRTYCALCVVGLFDRRKRRTADSCLVRMAERVPRTDDQKAWNLTGYGIGLMMDVNIR